MESRHLLLHLNLFEDAVKTTSKQKSITLQPIVQISFPSAVYLGNSLGIVWMIKRPTELWARGGELFFTVHTPLGSSFGCQCLNFLQVFMWDLVLYEITPLYGALASTLPQVPFLLPQSPRDFPLCSTYASCSVRHSPVLYFCKVLPSVYIPVSVSASTFFQWSLVQNIMKSI